MAEGMLRVRRFAGWISSPCPGTSKGAKLYAKRERRHIDFIVKRKRLVTAQIEKALDRWGDDAKRRWRELNASAEAAEPMPCLSFACKDW